MIGGFYPGAMYPGGTVPFAPAAEAITGTGAVAFAGPALAGLGVADQTTGSFFEPPSVTSRPRVRQRQITGRGVVRIEGPDALGQGSLGITGTGAIEVQTFDVVAGGGQDLAGTGAAALPVPVIRGSGAVVPPDVIDTAWVELQRKQEEDDLMVMLVALL